MGYVHDTQMSRIVRPGEMQKSAGTWTDQTATQVWSQRRTAAASAPVLKIPIVLPQNAVAQKGAYVKSVDVWYEISTAALTALSAAIYRRTMPADATAYGAPASQTFTYDTGHDAAAERNTVAKHKMTLTLTAPFWLDEDDEAFVEVTVDASGAGTAVFDIHAARVNYTFRI